MELALRSRVEFEGFRAFYNTTVQGHFELWLDRKTQQTTLKIDKMALENKADVLRIPNQLWFSYNFFALFVTFFLTYFVLNVAATVSYDRKLDIQNCNILCFTELWLNNDIINIQLAGYTLYRQERTAASGKTGWRTMYFCK